MRSAGCSRQDGALRHRRALASQLGDGWLCAGGRGAAGHGRWRRSRSPGRPGPDGRMPARWRAAVRAHHDRRHAARGHGYRRHAGARAPRRTAAPWIEAGHRAGQHVRPPGEDIRRGRSRLAAGIELRPAHLGLLASLGYRGRAGAAPAARRHLLHRRRIAVARRGTGARADLRQQPLFAARHAAAPAGGGHRPRRRPGHARGHAPCVRVGGRAGGRDRVLRRRVGRRGRLT